MFRCIAAVVGLVVWLLPAHVHSADPAADWRGVKVLPKENAVVKVGTEIIDDSKWSIPYVVQDVNGDWLWVGDRRKGWVQRSQVVKIDAGGSVIECHMCFIACPESWCTVDELSESWGVKIDLMEERYECSMQLRGFNDGNEFL